MQNEQICGKTELRITTEPDTDFRKTNLVPVVCIASRSSDEKCPVLAFRWCKRNQDQQTDCDEEQGSGRHTALLRLQPAKTVLCYTA